MPTGPRGEKRPASPVSSMVKAMRIATGIDEEEYEDGKPRDPVEPSSENDPEEPEYEMAALEIGKSKKRGKHKRKVPRKRRPQDA